MTSAPDMHWARWGDPEAARPLADSAHDLVELAFGPSAEQATTPLPDVRLPEPGLDPALVAELAGMLGADHVRTDHESRVRHTRGKSTPDLLRMRQGDGADAPDVVALPADHADVAAVLSWCSERRVAVVPFGGGTSRVGGLAARRDGYAGVVALELRRLERLVSVEPVSMTAVLVPADAAGVARVIEACAAAGVAVVPFGGGTSVVGGVDPIRGAHSAVVSLDLRRLRDVEVDQRSMTARLGAGLLGPEAEALLAEQDVTLGHFPQSFEYASIGGFAATRSAGQASSGYGRFDEQVASLRMATPIGELSTRESPHTAAGPALRELALGSEGTLGVITEVRARVRPAPAERRYEAWMASGFEEGAEIVRELSQEDLAPDVLRLSDREETRVSLALSGTQGLARRALDAYLQVRRRSDGCLLICGWEGEAESIARRQALGTRFLRRGGAVPLGPAPGKAWEKGRYGGPYLRDELLDLGYMVETLETSHTWSRLDELYRGVGNALRSSLESQGTPPIVFCHISHSYRDGASLYFTFLARSLPGRELEQWRAAKTAACEAIVAAEGTITHHHAVGRDHAPYMPAEVGEVGLEALRALKERLDPAGVMNPGKLIPGL
jgi:alkyldihydroxyacetonephosphate synthase